MQNTLWQQKQKPEVRLKLKHGSVSNFSAAAVTPQWGPPTLGTVKSNNNNSQGEVLCDEMNSTTGFSWHHQPIHVVLLWFMISPRSTSVESFPPILLQPIHYRLPNCFHSAAATQIFPTAEHLYSQELAPARSSSSVFTFHVTTRRCCSEQKSTWSQKSMWFLHSDCLLNKKGLAKDHLTLFYGNRMEGKGNSVKCNLSNAPLNRNSPVRNNNKLH